MGCGVSRVMTAGLGGSLLDPLLWRYSSLAFPSPTRRSGAIHHTHAEISPERVPYVLDAIHGDKDIGRMHHVRVINHHPMVLLPPVPLSVG